ncbi:hypothetical protein C1J01_10875 [Nonomuraea aridisoli]|uniref:Uncharacterized protein n=2 Tax=Nonomuraea aridisoli TaxID=2070368 RepID=A0A2W2F2C0_9ACTN|nr:hypothetical protein C1J01_10875 [Nonomuraea aridisoli]
MLDAADPITFAAVARQAKVSTWLVYAEGVREHIEQAMKRQADAPLHEQRAGLTASPASLRTDLELARDQIKQLRAERDKLRGNLRLQLGQQLEEISSKGMAERIDELAIANQRLAMDNQQAADANEQLKGRIAELEEELAAARASLRRVLRETNRPSPIADRRSGSRPGEPAAG